MWSTCRTGIDGNIDNVSPWGTEYCPKWGGGQYFDPRGAHLISVAHKQSVWNKTRQDFKYKFELDCSFTFLVPHFSSITLENKTNVFAGC